MKDRDYQNIIELSFCNGVFLPANDAGREISETLADGQILPFHEVSGRDLMFHKLYMVFLKDVWNQLTPAFKKNIPDKYFYEFLKAYKCQYDFIYSIKNEKKCNEIRDFLKMLKKEFTANKVRLPEWAIKIICEKFGRVELAKFKSIGFGSMSQNTFENFVREQLPYIFEVVHELYDFKENHVLNIDKANAIINEIEKDFAGFLKQLIK